MTTLEEFNNRIGKETPYVTLYSGVFLSIDVFVFIYDDGIVFDQFDVKANEFEDRTEEQWYADFKLAEEKFEKSIVDLHEEAINKPDYFEKVKAIDAQFKFAETDQEVIDCVNDSAELEFIQVGKDVIVEAKNKLKLDSVPQALVYVEGGCKVTKDNGVVIKFNKKETVLVTPTSRHEYFFNNADDFFDDITDCE